MGVESCLGAVIADVGELTGKDRKLQKDRACKTWQSVLNNSLPEQLRLRVMSERERTPLLTIQSFNACHACILDFSGEHAL